MFVEFVLGVVAVLLFYIYAYSPFDYWKKCGVTQVPVELPVVGNFVRGLSEPAAVRLKRNYDNYPDERYVGTYDVRTPVLLIRDPDLVESFLIKDFSHFYNRGNPSNPETKLGKHLLNLKDERWKGLRNKLTPTFTTGKLKGMHSQLVECGENLIRSMKKLEDGRPFEIRDVVSRFTMDVIASCAFGLNLDTINDSESPFRKIGLTSFTPSLFTQVVLKLPQELRTLLKRLNIGSTPPQMLDYFIGAVDETIAHRAQNKMVRPDFLHLMNELYQKDKESIEKKQLDPKDPHVFDHSTLVSNAFVFFLAGFETTATTISYAMYELAMNDDVQEEVFKEVSSVLRKHGGTPTFDACQEMELLERVISETLRKYPPAVSVDRKASHEYTVPGSNLTLPAGSNILVPIYALHHDPQYFPDPEKFLPERFDESKTAIRKGTYLPFGGGPRICIGARFARLEAKVGLAMIVNNFQLVRSEKTVSPLKFAKLAVTLVPEGGVWVAVRPRNKTA